MNDRDRWKAHGRDGGTGGEGRGRGRREAHARKVGWEGGEGREGEGSRNREGREDGREVGGSE